MSVEMHGSRVCEAGFGNVPSYGMYAIAIFSALLGTPFILMGLPMLAGRLKGEFEGGLAAIAVGLILVGAGAAAWVSANSSRRNLRLVFYTNGLTFGPADDLRFVSYRECKAFVVEVIHPDDMAWVRAAFRGCVSLLHGNGAGIGMAIVSTQAEGVIRFQIGDEPVMTIGLPSRDAEAVGRHASTARHEKVLIHSDR